MNCPIRQHTADGVSVGRCWHFVGHAPPYRCPVHGDVGGPVALFVAEKKLTDDDFAPRRQKKETGR
jgi:hypothetical protein